MFYTNRSMTNISIENIEKLSRSCRDDVTVRLPSLVSYYKKRFDVNKERRTTPESPSLKDENYFSSAVIDSVADFGRKDKYSDWVPIVEEICMKKCGVGMKGP